MNSDNENDSNNSAVDEESGAAEKGEKSVTLEGPSEYDFDDNNIEDSNHIDKTVDDQVETGQKRGRGRPPKVAPVKVREPEGSPPRKSARIAKKQV